MSLINGGGLLKFHEHENKDVLDLFSIINNELYFNGEPLKFKVSNKEDNAITIEEDGIYINKTLIQGIKFLPVLKLPTEDIDLKAIYLVPNGSESSDSESEANLFTEYVYINNKWERFGTIEFQVDLSDYYTKSEIDNLITFTEQDVIDIINYLWVPDEYINFVSKDNIFIFYISYYIIF